MGVADAPIKAGTRVLCRVDFNVPMNVDGTISDDKRMTDSLPTIRYCLERGAKVILCSHFGRPEGTPDPAYSLRPVYEHLRTLLPGVVVEFAPATVGSATLAQVAALPDGGVLLLENTRFTAAETANDSAFAKALAMLGDIFVNDAFGSAHRAHASTVGVAEYLPSYAGLLMAREIEGLSQITENPKRPFTVIIGGKKASDKLPLARKLADVADNLLVGGRIAQEWVDDGVKHRAQIHIAPDQGLDISPATVAAWRPIIEKSKTIFWNGPLGQFEDQKNSNGTRAVAKIVAESSAVSVVGGGDTAAAVKDFKFTHVSTGGGAALEFVEGTELPGIKVLRKGDKK